MLSSKESDKCILDKIHFDFSIHFLLACVSIAAAAVTACHPVLTSDCSFSGFPAWAEDQWLSGNLPGHQHQEGGGCWGAQIHSLSSCWVLHISSVKRQLVDYSAATAQAKLTCPVSWCMYSISTGSISVRTLPDMYSKGWTKRDYSPWLNFHRSIFLFMCIIYVHTYVTDFSPLI